jgi:hypothetical protein
MLKAKHPRKKHKPVHKKNKSRGISLPNNMIIQNTEVPRGISYGGIPYQSSQSLFSLTNKTPYLLESLIAKPAMSQMTQPAPSATTSVTQGANIMTQTKSMADQTKTTPVQFIDLVNPAKNGNNETQPEYIMTNKAKPKTSTTITNEEKVQKKLKRIEKQEKMDNLRRGKNTRKEISPFKI